MEKDSSLRKQKREQILQTASELFARYGFKKASLEEIASAVGLRKTSLYYYFSSKEELFKAVIQREAEQVFKKLLQSIAKCKTARDKLKRYFLTKFRAINDMVNLYQITREAVHQMLPMAEELRKEFFEREKSLLIQILREGIQTKDFRVKDVNTTAILLLEITQELDPVTSLYTNGKTKTKYFDTLFDIIFNGILSKEVRE